MCVLFIFFGGGEDSRVLRYFERSTLVFSVEGGGLSMVAELEGTHEDIQVLRRQLAVLKAVIEVSNY